MVDLAAGTFVTPTVRLVRRLRRGGMGEVWTADHLSLRTQVVVKFLGQDADNPATIARFQREAAAAAQVKSPHVVQTLDFGVAPGGMPFIVMELLEGQDLAQTLKGRTLSVNEVAHVVDGVSLALAKAHERGIVHRDIKPANIFLCDAGGGMPFVKVVDFGIAKGIDDHNPVTTTGDVIGTPAYMSPEQLQGERDVDHRTDLWSLGVVAYRAAVGSLPFQGENVGAVAVSVLSAPLPRPSANQPTLPSGFDTWFARACSRDRRYRFGSAREMAEAMWAVAQGRAPAALASAPPAPISNAGFMRSGEVPAVVEPTGTTRATSMVTGAPQQQRSSGLLAALIGVLTAVVVLGIVGVAVIAPRIRAGGMHYEDASA
ncbi:MAG: serine/threonine protein kinase, partial [Polyangiaceae bacterium]|nr:serine/threonine protein kinase [Polyangiaceae bacterium]